MQMFFCIFRNVPSVVNKTRDELDRRLEQIQFVQIAAMNLRYLYVLIKFHFSFRSYRQMNNTIMHFTRLGSQFQYFHTHNLAIFLHFSQKIAGNHVTKSIW